MSNKSLISQELQKEIEIKIEEYYNECLEKLKEDYKSFAEYKERGLPDVKEFKIKNSQ